MQNAKRMLRPGHYSRAMLRKSNQLFEKYKVHSECKWRSFVVAPVRPALLLLEDGTFALNFFFLIPLFYSLVSGWREMAMTSSAYTYVSSWFPNYLTNSPKLPLLLMVINGDWGRFSKVQLFRSIYVNIRQSIFMPGKILRFLRRDAKTKLIIRSSNTD